MNTALPVSFDQDRLDSLCRSHSVARLLLFGSVVRSDFGPSSDVDVLVEFFPSVSASLMKMARLQIELSELIGRDVHLTTPRSLSKYFAEDVIRSALPVYVAA